MPISRVSIHQDDMIKQYYHKFVKFLRRSSSRPLVRANNSVFNLLLLIFLIISSLNIYPQQKMVNNPDSTNIFPSDYLNIRGIERGKNHVSAHWRSVLNVLFFIPQKMLDGILFSSIYGARLILGSKEIERADDFFLKTPKTVVWTPIVLVDSDWRPLVGLTVLYRKNRWGNLVAGRYTSDNKWDVRANLSYSTTKRLGVWNLKLNGLIEEDDDLRYYGIGANPAQDERSHFLPGTDSSWGIYSHRREKVEAILGIRPSQRWEFFFSSSYKKRRMKDAAYKEPNIGDVVDINRLAGFESPIQQWYNELAVRYDSRHLRGKFSPGAKIEGYLGVSNGLGDDQSEFFRAGIDLAGFFPVIRENRLIVPRFLFDMVEVLKDDVPLPFSEYPHIREYRGTSRSKVLRTDYFTLLSSLEYQWPISTHLNSHLFYDLFMVSREIDKFSLGNRLWAVGIGLDYHTFEEEVLRVEFITGSDGFRIRLNFGLGNFSRRDLN